MLKPFRILLAGTLFLVSFQASAAVSPLGVAVLAPVQFPPTDFSIAGARASAFWGHHRNVYGVDLGLVGNITDQDFVGLAASGVFNMTHGATTVVGFQLAGIANINENKTRILGAQVALVNSNSAESLLMGIGIGVIANYTPHTRVGGAQIGLYNRAADVYGFQIGLVNMADSLHGIQVGLLNFNKTGLFYVAPILNIGF